MNVEISHLKFARDEYHQDLPTWTAAVRIQDHEMDETAEVSFVSKTHQEHRDEEKGFHWQYDYFMEKIVENLGEEKQKEVKKKIKKLLVETQKQIIQNERKVEFPSFRTFRVDKKNEKYEVTFTLEEEHLKRYKMTIFPNKEKEMWERTNVTYFDTKYYRWQTYSHLVPYLSWEDVMYDRIVGHISKEKNLRVRHLFKPLKKRYYYRFHEERKE